jgi:hypothetical protein
MVATNDKDCRAAAGAAPVAPVQAGPTATAPRVVGARSPDFRLEIARSKLGNPNLEIGIWERFGSMEKYEGCFVTVGEPRILTRGKRKGERSWSHLKKSEMERIRITVEQEQAAELEYEATTGNCHNCGGGGEQWDGWSAAEGSRYITCRRCKGTGEAPAIKLATEG